MKRTGRRLKGWVLAILFAVIFAGELLQASADGGPLQETASPETSSALPEAEGNEKVYLDIDSHYKYDGMKQSFSEGYQPAAEDGILHLVIPFIASGDLAGNRLTVNLVFSDGAAAAIVPKNYQKMVEKKQYVLKEGTMVCLGGDVGLSGGGREVYLYCMEIPLSGAAAAGSCAVTVQAVGYTEEMEQVLLTRQIVFSLPEMGKPGGEDQAEDKNEEDGNGEGTTKDQVNNEKGGENKEDGAKGEEGSGGEESTGGSSGEKGGGSGLGEERGEELIRQPKILLETDNLSGKELSAGSEETLTVSFRNCSESQHLYNLKVSASVEGSGLRLSRNSFYAASAAPGESFPVETGLFVAPDAACGEIPVVFDFEYEDKRGNAVSGKETVVLSVRQPVELECLTGEIPDVMYASDTLELSLKACNVSRAPVYNVRADLSAEGLFPDGEVFIGNLEAGASGEGMLYIYVGTRTMEAAGSGRGGSDGEKYGPVEGTVTFRYEDNDGKVYEETKQFQTEIKKAQIASFAVEEPEEVNSWWVSVSAVVFVGLVFWILLLLFRLRKKNELLAEAGGRSE